MTVLLSSVLFPWQKGQSQIVIGEPIAFTIISPISTQYNSELLTNQRRQVAADAIEDIYILNPDIRDTQVALLDKQLNNINQIKSNPVTASSVKESEIKKLEIVVLDDSVISSILSMDNELWDQVSLETKNILTKILTSSLTYEESEAIKRSTQIYIPVSYSEEHQSVINQIVISFIKPTLIIDQERTILLREQAKAMQPVELISINQGDVILNKNDIVSDENFEMLDQVGLLKAQFDMTVILVTVLKSILISFIFVIFVYFMRPKSLSSIKKLVIFSLILIISFGILNIFYTNFFNEDNIFIFHLLPLVTFPMVTLILTELSVALLLTSLMSMMIALISLDSISASLLLNTSLEFSRTWITFFASSLTAIIVLRQAERQQQYLYAGLISSGVSVLISIIYWLNQSVISFYDLILISMSTIGGGLFSSILALGLVNFLSVPFGILTRVKLMELAQLDNKLLRRLQDEAPGTFQHSLLVGTLVERAADRISADSLLARVGAYYHDIGKLVSPSFFAENLKEKSPHESLDPLQSTRVIHQHVTAGVEIAKKDGLPDVIVQFIQQHHGTRLASFFYRIAAEKTPEIDTELFRYPGPKPQSKEVALVMLADSSEAAVRASSDHSSEKIIEIVDTVIKERFDEDQLDECDLSIKEIRIAADSISTALIAVFHPRVGYPEPTKQELIDRGIYSVGVDENIINDNNEDGTQLSLGTIDKSDKIN
ncbi:MAG: HDIG domain-containing protein [Dehalococcoidia bacterium]|nr:HDIG domain-containing protein [Dehalococcoidia bacterium]